MYVLYRRVFIQGHGQVYRHIACSNDINELKEKIVTLCTTGTPAAELSIVKEIPFNIRAAVQLIDEVRE